jgi:hypothetical protein
VNAATETGRLDGRNGTVIPGHRIAKMSRRYRRDYAAGLEIGRAEIRAERAEQRAAIVDLVTAHHDAGHPAHDVRRALIDLAADSLEPVIREVIAEIYV